MGILNLLASNNYFIYNKDIAKNTSIETAVILGLLCSKYNYYQLSNQLLLEDNKQWFYCTRETIFDETGIKEGLQRNAEKPLKEFGILELKKKGIPSKNYYCINEEKLLETLENFSSLKNKELDTSKSNNNTLENQRQIIINNNKQLNNKNINNINIINENSENIKKPSNKKLTKQQINAIECKKILDEFIKDEDIEIQNALKDYVEVRKTKGLQPKQLQIILEDFEKAYNNKSKSIILKQIRNATAGGWLKLSYDNSFKGTPKASYSSKPTFDNTANHDIGKSTLNDTEFNKLTDIEKEKYLEKLPVADMTPLQKEYFNNNCLVKDWK